VPDRRIIKDDARANLRAELRHAYEVEHQTIRELGQAHDLSYGRVQKLLREAGTTMRPRGGSRRAG
jgi:hypothetical protein